MELPQVSWEPVDSRSNHLERVGDSCEAFSVADHQIASRNRVIRQSMYQLFLLHPIKVDHRVAAENDLEFSRPRIVFLEKVYLLEAQTFS